MTILIKKSATANFETIEINDTPLGKGGQGAVHNITTSKYSADYCIKIYIHDAEKMHKKIEYMVSHPPQNIRDTSFRICWPTALAYNTKKEFIGYMMPLAFPKGHDLTILSVYRSKPLSQLKRFKNKVDWHNKYELDTNDGIVNRVKMLCNIAIALHTIHSTGRYVLVDLKPENIDATGAGKVSIMDTDSIQISENGKILHPATAFTPEYFAPEGKELKGLNRPFTLQCDYFAAAICFYQILTGTHPYSGTVLKSPYENCTEIADCISNGLFAFGEKQRYIDLPAGFNLQQNFYNLPSTVQELFKRAFGSQASKRPTMEEWGRTFHEIIRGGVKVGPSVVKRDTAGIPFKITGLAFSDEDYEGNVIRSSGSKLYNDTTYLVTYLSYTALNNVGNVDIYYKIIDPNGVLVTNTDTKGRLELTTKGSYTKRLGGWGNKNKTAYSTPGEYNIEFYYKGKCLYKSKFTIHDKSSVAILSIPLAINNVKFKDITQQGNLIRSEGSQLYTDIQFLAPVVYYDVHRSVTDAHIWIKIISPSGKTITNQISGSNCYQSPIDLSKVDTGFYQTMAGWGNSNSTLYNESGTYNVEFYYENKLIYSTDLYIAQKKSYYTSTTKNSIRSSGGLWRRMNNAIERFGERIDDSIDSVSDSSVWTIIIGIIGAIGLIAAAISTDSIFWGIVVAFFGLGIGYYVVLIGGVIISFIARFILYIFRYLFYNIYTVILAILITVGVIIGPRINELIDNRSGAETVVNVPNADTEVSITYYCTASSVLNIRSSPNEDAKVIGTIKNGQSIQVYNIVDGYAKFKYGSGYGYASTKYLRKAD